MICAPSKDSDQPGHLSSLIRAFAVRFLRSLDSHDPSYRQRRLWSDLGRGPVWYDAHAILLVLSYAGSVFVLLSLWMTILCMFLFSTVKTLTSECFKIFFVSNLYREGFWCYLLTAKDSVAIAEKIVLLVTSFSVQAFEVIIDCDNFLLHTIPYCEGSTVICIFYCTLKSSVTTCIFLNTFLKRFMPFYFYT